jgi:hypothetical protein
LSWCVGCNPPFVFCGIRLIGLPAPQVDSFTGVCLPFPLAGQPFHRFRPRHTQRHKAHHRHMHERTCRFCSVAKALAFSPYRECNSTRGRSFLRSHTTGTRKPHTNSPAQKRQNGSCPIKAFHAKLALTNMSECNKDT